MTTTTQDTRALIARLQARLGEGTQGPFYVVNPDDDSAMNAFAVSTREDYDETLGEGCDHESIVAITLLQYPRVCCPPSPDWQHGKMLAWQANATIIAAALNELPAQIARWLARLDEADRIIQSNPSAFARTETLIATVTEDVQAWEAQIERLGVGE